MAVMAGLQLSCQKANLRGLTVMACLSCHISLAKIINIEEISANNASNNSENIVMARKVMKQWRRKRNG